MQLLLKKRWPKYLRQFSELKFISIGECRYGWPLGLNEDAHAHGSRLKRDNHCFGTICLRRPEYLNHRNIMIHEVCHLMFGSYGHNDKWREWVLAYGGTLESYWLEDHWTCDYTKNGNYPKD